MEIWFINYKICILLTILKPNFIFLGNPFKVVTTKLWFLFLPLDLGVKATDPENLSYFSANKIH